MDDRPDDSEETLPPIPDSEPSIETIFAAFQKNLKERLYGGSSPSNSFDPSAEDVAENAAGDGMGAYPPPEPRSADHAPSSRKPVTLDTGADQFQEHLIGPSLERRKREWVEDVEEDIARLEDGNTLDFKELQSDEEFVSVFLRASRAAVRTHRQEKRDALRNAVLNTALGRGAGEIETQMFIRLVDQYTMYHLWILILLHDPHRWVHEHEINPSDSEGQKIVLWLLGELDVKVQGQAAFYESICGELVDRGLLEPRAGTITVSENLDSYTTSLGERFLSLIKAPPDDLVGGRK
ncbi:MAG: hypothetical protein ABEL04_11925 [Salinibacter sp.]|uniref:hypothetical protein n=1 Tax=Salinibacter sp. TaxID=2065818 RepID=UPI0035D464FA